MKTIEFKQLDETLYYKKLDNGLDVYILPKKGFSKTLDTGKIISAAMAAG